MAGDVLRELMARLRRFGDEAGGLSDAELLARYALTRDEAAFELLVWRHGGLVLSTARRWLGNEADAEDVFQAAFLTLARKAGSIRRGASLPAWLHQVVGRIALRERKRRARRRLVEAPLNGHDPGREAARPDDVGPVLDEEVARLPERYRRVVVLCYLQGRGVTEAAAALGCPRGTVLSRLAAARALLQRRLLRRGVAPALLAGVAVESSAAAPAAALVANVLRLVGAATDVPANILQMSNGVIQAMFWKKCRTLAALALIAGLCGVGAGAGRADKPGVVGAEPPAKAKAEAPPRRPDAGPARDQLSHQVVEAESVLADLDRMLLQQRAEDRAQMIEIEERLRELEHRQAWEREQQRRTLQNLDATLRERRAQQKVSEARIPERQAEVVEAERIASRAKESLDKKLVPATEFEANVARMEKTRRSLDAEMTLLKGLRQEIETLLLDIAKATDQAATAEDARTKERIKLRRQMVHIEETVQANQRAHARRLERAAGDYEAALARLRAADGAPTAPLASPNTRDLQRKVEALQREVDDLRRELKRPAKPE